MGAVESEHSGPQAMMDIVWLAAAERDLMHLYDRAELSQGGDQLLENVRRSTENLRAFPFIAPAFADRIRRLVLVGRSLGVFYCVEGARVMVLRVLDLRQEPGTIRRKLGLD
jgi:plasmid stabilization system protein ParE